MVSRDLQPSCCRAQHWSARWAGEAGQEMGQEETVGVRETEDCPALVSGFELKSCSLKELHRIWGLEGGSLSLSLQGGAFVVQLFFKERGWGPALFEAGHQPRRKTARLQALKWTQQNRTGTASFGTWEVLGRWGLARPPSPPPWGGWNGRLGWGELQSPLTLPICWSGALGGQV